MAVKVRKVGNSYTLTIPAQAVASLKLHDGQELEVSVENQKLEYRIAKKPINFKGWEKYETRDTDLRDGMTADEYVRSLRADDRESVF